MYTLQSGLPYTVSSTSGLGLAGLTGSVLIPAVVNSCSSGYSPSGSAGSKLNDYINPSCFSPLPTIANGTVLSNLTPSEGPGNQSYTIGGAAGDTSGGTLFGYGARNIARGPFEQRFDLALIKDFHFRERFDLQFRAEAFKLFNNVIFANPAANISNYNANPALNAFGVISCDSGQHGPHFAAWVEAELLTLLSGREAVSCGFPTEVSHVDTLASPTRGTSSVGILFE